MYYHDQELAGAACWVDVGKTLCVHSPDIPAKFHRDAI